jgi:hypothetical protein
MTQVEIHWPESAPTEPLRGAVDLLEESGVQTEALLQPVRRGIPVAVLIFVATPIVESFLKTLFEKVGSDAYDGVRRFVRRLIDSDGEQPAEGPTAVVFECVGSRAQFVFTPGLPDKAFRAALAVDAGTDGGRWVWDSTRHEWLRFEGRAVAE